MKEKEEGVEETETEWGESYNKSQSCTFRASLSLFYYFMCVCLTTSVLNILIIHGSVLRVISNKPIGGLQYHSLSKTGRQIALVL